MSYDFFWPLLRLAFFLPLLRSAISFAFATLGVASLGLLRLGLQDFADAVGVAAALGGEVLGFGPHLAGYLAADVADFFGLQGDAFGFGYEDGEVLDFVLDGIGILGGTGCTAYDGYGFAVLGKGQAFVDFAGREIGVGLLRILALDADAVEVLHYLIDMIGVDGVIDGDVPVVMVELEGMGEHFF